MTDIPKTEFKNYKLTTWSSGFRDGGHVFYPITKERQRSTQDVDYTKNHEPTAVTVNRQTGETETWEVLSDCIEKLDGKDYLIVPMPDRTAQGEINFRAPDTPTAQKIALEYCESTGVYYYLSEVIPLVYASLPEEKYIRNSENFFFRGMKA